MGTLVRFDWAMKRLLRHKANFAILEGFLSELLKEDIKIIEILESESNRLTADDKQNRVDMLVKNSKEELIIIEIQQNDEVDYFHRMTYAASKLVIEQLDKGDHYGKIKSVISINILYFDLGRGKDYIYKGTTQFKGLHTGDLLQLSQEQKDLYIKSEIHEIFPEYYMLKINNFNDVAKDSLDEWIYFFKNSEIKDSFKARGIQKAKETLKELNLSKDDRIDYDNFVHNWRVRSNEIETALMKGEAYGKAVGLEVGKVLGLEEGKALGIEAGKAIGLEKGKIEIALKAKKMGMSVREITNLTGLKEEEVNQLSD